MGQAVPDCILNDIAQIARIAYDVFTNPNRPIGNIETYCKSQKCRDALRGKEFELRTETIAFLVDAEDVKIKNARSQKEQLFDNSVTADIEVFKIGSAKWTVYLIKGKEQGHLNGYEEKMLEIVINCANNIYQAYVQSRGGNSANKSKT
jgi:hypothetical protein